MNTNTTAAAREIDLQIDIINKQDLPDRVSEEDIQSWILSTLDYEIEKGAVNSDKPIEISLNIVNKQEIQSLNDRYREQNKTTNVLSFPSDIPDDIDVNLLGDIVICAQVVKEEAEQQSKSEQAHWAHMLVHSSLHLLNYDHIAEEDAQLMEQHEIDILQQLGFKNPYL